MPRVNLAGDSYKNKDLTELFRLHKAKKGLNNTEAGKLIGVSERTFARYLENPEMIPLKKLRAMRKTLQIPKEDMAALLV